ncbi:MAG: dihydroorotate dehydrogenase (quinone) [Elusimicrobia bacterium RIFOXYA12_FULL_57_11]|nr:MAG: dihydroorotate dehydrogenase (quinone) [Elusimicrobia bacterium RIFOXYA12_FULL_57_11]
MSFLYKKLVRQLLFSFNPELVHDAVIKSACVLQRLAPLNSLVSLLARAKDMPVTVAGIDFRNPVGLAAGFDKNCEAARFLAGLGFGFLELGTVTLRPQPGNPKPRVFRLRESKAIINRMGFNNAGAWDAARSLEGLLPLPIPVGISIGKNADCSIEGAPQNYLETLKVLYSYGSYFAVNISSPNTLQLHRLHEGERLRRLMGPLLSYAAGQGRVKPFFIKITPDLPDAGIEGVVRLAAELGFGLITTNTTASRDAVPPYWRSYEGGLSGLPLRKAANSVLSRVAALAGGRVPIIGSGGIFDGPAALEKLDLGASLVQVYSGLVYEGPLLVKEIMKHLDRSRRGTGVSG